MLRLLETNKVKVILEQDPAVIGGDYEQYKAEGFDEKKLKLKGEPTRFVIRQVSAKKRTEISSTKHKVLDYSIAIISCGLIGIEGLEIVKKDGTVEAIGELPKENKGPILGDVVKESFVDNLNMPLDFIIALSEAIVFYSEYVPPFCQMRLAALSGAGEEPNQTIREEESENQP